jgi:3-phosphoshikimate 1-carboxyvinyltransferase
MGAPLSKAKRMTAPPPRAEASGRAGPLRGRVAVPGDKSISHRALMLAAMAAGTSRIEGLSDGSDVHSTAAALREMGAAILRAEDGAVLVRGLGTGGLLQPERALDMGNSGTSTRLLMGLAAGHRIGAHFHGDASLSRRPMERVAAPLRRIGADVATAPGGRLPLSVRGACPPAPAEHRLDVASAQVKSALLLAGLTAPGLTRVIEPASTRDHTERMLALFGADIECEGPLVALRGEAELRPQRLAVPGDPSSAAFLAVAALIVPGSEVRLDGVCVNPLRIGLYEVLREMGADISFENGRNEAGEPVADIRVRHSELRGIEVPPALVPAMIDEFPILFVAAAFARGPTRARGLAELRVKESDRISAMAAGLAAAGVRVEESEDGLAVHGAGGAPLPGGASIDPRLDHRIAMSFAVAGLRTAEPIGVVDMSPVSTSWPGFAAALEALHR